MIEDHCLALVLSKTGPHFVDLLAHGALVPAVAQHVFGLHVLDHVGLVPTLVGAIVAHPQCVHLGHL